MYWRNSNFQYVYFIFGACNTAIEAHKKCVEAIEDRELSLFEAETKTTAIPDDYAGKHYTKILNQAKDELNFLYNCKKRLEEFIGKEPTIEDYQDNQREEWLLELKQRVENNLLTTGIIPTDSFAAMRQHPDFKLILEHINLVKKTITNNEEMVYLEKPWASEKFLLQDKT